MQTVISNGKLMPGIYRAVIMEALTVQYNGEDVKCARIYIPALHKDQMPFTVDGDGTITGLNVSSSRNTSGGLTVTSYSSSTTSTNTNTSGTSNNNTNNNTSTSNNTSTNTGSSNNTSTTSGTSNTTNNTTSSTTGNTSNTANNNNSNNNSSSNSTTTSSNSVPNNDSLVMTLNDYPVAQISCWKFCPEVKLGEPVWVVFENADSEYPIILGDLGAILPLLSQAAISGGGGSSGSSGSSYIFGAGNTVIDKAVDWAVKVAQDDSIGYSQSDRWGPNNYDCSSFVISAYNQAGVPLRNAGANSTHDMISAMEQCGFVEITSQVDFSTGQGLQKGDVLWRSSHTEMMISSSERVGAHTDNYSNYTYMTREEFQAYMISVQPYKDNSWSKAFRYIDTSTSNNSNTNSNSTNTTNGNTTTIP